MKIVIRHDWTTFYDNTGTGRLGPALAAGYDDFADIGRKPHRRNLRTEWGITAGAHYTGIRLFGQEASMKASPRLGYEAGVHMALRFGDWLALQPEIYYSHTTIDMQADGVDGKIRVKSHAVEFPVLLSLRVLDPVRINAGPVITLMNNSSYIAPDGVKTMFGNTRPTFCYTVGASVCIAQHLLVDARFTGQFSTTLNNFEKPISGRNYIPYRLK